MRSKNRSVYIMESKEEARRLELKTQYVETLEHLKLAGLRKGMDVVDVGCGTGAVTRVMAKVVVPGRVVGIDFSEERLAVARKLAKEEGLKNIEFKKFNVTLKKDILLLPKHSFDFVWARFLFEYLKKPQEVLSAMRSMAVSGGKIVVVDLDGHQGSFLYPISKGLEKNISSVFGILQRNGFDPFVGRKLYNMFYKAKLKNIKVHILPYQLIAGKANDNILTNWRMKFQTLMPVLKDGLGGKGDKLVSEFITHLKRKDTSSFTLLFLLEGIK